jgi:hypothetical protein
VSCEYCDPNVATPSGSVKWLVSSKISTAGRTRAAGGAVLGRRAAVAFVAMALVLAPPSLSVCVRGGTWDAASGPFRDQFRHANSQRF